MATLTLQLLSTTASNADSEQIFSLVRQIETSYCSSHATETVSAFIGCPFNNTAVCPEISYLNDSLLLQAKIYTRPRNFSKESFEYQEIVVIIFMFSLLKIFF